MMLALKQRNLGLVKERKQGNIQKELGILESVKKENGEGPKRK